MRLKGKITKKRIETFGIVMLIITGMATLAYLVRPQNVATPIDCVTSRNQIEKDGFQIVNSSSPSNQFKAISMASLNALETVAQSKEQKLLFFSTWDAKSNAFSFISYVMGGPLREQFIWFPVNSTIYGYVCAGFQ